MQFMKAKIIQNFPDVYIALYILQMLTVPVLSEGFLIDDKFFHLESWNWHFYHYS